MAITINYKGSQLTSFESGTKTLKTAGKYLDADVDITTKYTLTVTGTGNSSYLFFKVNNETTKHYTAETLQLKAGDILKITAFSRNGGGVVNVNGELVGGGSGGVNGYQYTFPASDVSLKFTYLTSLGTADIFTQYGLQSKSVTPSTTAITVTPDTGCYGLSSVTVSAADPYTEDLIKKYIARNTSFTDIVWPSGLTAIGPCAFAYATYFNPSSLPSTITSIGTSAFWNCTRLALTSLPSGITLINASAFKDCPRLALTSLPNSLTWIYPETFSGCTDLALTSLPSSLTSIANKAFYNCTNLAITSLPNTVTYVDSYAFQNCTGLTSMTIPNSLTGISSYTFSGCTGLTSLILPDTLNTIGTYSFQHCTNLISISCNGPLANVGAGAFNGTSTRVMQLKTVNFPNMTGALTYTFGNGTAANACQQLEFIDIGSASRIDGNALANCYALKTMVIRKTGSICTLSGVSAFINTPMRGYNSQTGTIYVPSALINSYQTASNWSTLYSGGTVTFSALEGSIYE